MIKLRNICLRLSSLGLAACFIFALCVPASAAGPYDFWDMNPTLTPEGDNTIVSVSIPTDFCDSRIVLGNGTTVVGNSVIQSIVPANTSAKVRFYPFGYPNSSAYVDSLSLADIPSGTKLSLLFDFYTFPAYINSVFTCDIYYYDSNAVYLSTDTQSIIISSDDPFLFEYVLNKPVNADRAVIRFEHIDTAQAVEYTIRYELLSASFSMTLNSLLVQQQQTGRTNAILQKVEQQLADQGQTLDDVLKEQQDTNDKLDDIINGTVEPSSPAGSGAVDDLIDQEDQLIQDITPGLDDYNDITDTAMNGIGGYIGALMGVSWLIDTFVNVPFIAPLVYLSLALGLTGTVLGIFNTYINAQHHKSDARSRRRD